MYYLITKSEAKKIPAVTKEKMKHLQKKYGKYLVSESDKVKHLKSEASH